MRASAPWLRLACCLLLAMAGHVAGGAAFARDVTVTVDPNRAGADPSRWEQLGYGGFTPSYKPTQPMLAMLARDGFRHMRLINVEWDTQVRHEDGNITSVAWSAKLERELRICKKYGFIPHIIIGQAPPRGLEAFDNAEGRGRGLVSQALYRQYVNRLLQHVYQYWRFPQAVWEVGNEMDNPKWNWFAVKPLSKRLDPQGYRKYFELYRLIATEVDAFRASNPRFGVEIGGPALTQNSMNHKPDSPLNWYAGFLHDVLSNNVPCDFLSMHFYGSAGSREELRERLGWLDDIMGQYDAKVPVWITEWGTSAFFQKENANFSPPAGAFSLAFLEALAQSGVAQTRFIAVARHPDPKKWGPALLYRDRSPADAYRAIEWLAPFAGQSVRCTTDRKDVGCLSSVTENGMRLLLWKSQWATCRMGGVCLDRLARNYDGVNISISGANVAFSDVAVYANGSDTPASAPLDVKRGGAGGDIHAVRLPLHADGYWRLEFVRR